MVNNNNIEIFTLNARDNFILPLLKEYFNLNSKSINNEIYQNFITTKKILSSKGIQL